METILKFFSDLILFTAGLGVTLLWIIIFVEIYDNIKEIFQGSSTTLDDEEEDY